jgi:hypothetical protein
MPKSKHRKLPRSRRRAPQGAGRRGTNEYNFEKLENPPAFEPKRCATCGAAIRLAHGGYSQCGRDYWCESCSRNELKTREPRPVTPLGGRRRGHPAKD